jgi:TonB family protein
MHRPFALALLASALVTPVEAAPLAPTAKWVVNFDDAQCVAYRSYGEEQLVIKASPLGDVVQLGWMRPGGYGDAEQLDAQITPGGGETFKGNALVWSPPKSGRVIQLVNLPVADFQRLMAGPDLQLRTERITRHFLLSGVEAVSRVMKRCVDDLQQVWSASGEDAPIPVRSLGSYFSDDDFPDQAIRQRVQGTTEFAVLVDEKGSVADCMVTRTSGQAMLDAQSCAVLKERARFTPATDPEGKPRKGRITARINWKLGF